MNIALFGGSFNPPHLGHFAAIEALLLRKDLDEIWVLPTFKHPFEKTLLNFEDRLKLVEIAFKTCGNKVKVLGIEKEICKDKNWTIDTVRTLKKQFPGHKFFLVLGSDALEQNERWKDFDLLTKQIECIRIPRKGYEDSALPEISSSQIREQIRLKKDWKQWVNPDVFAYIQKNKLYES